MSANKDTMHQKALSRESSKIRILAIERMITSGRRIMASEIQRRLEARYNIVVDRKTIYSDIYAIDRFIPIDARGGRNGGYMKYDFLGEEDG